MGVNDPRRGWARAHLRSPVRTWTGPARLSARAGWATQCGSRSTTRASRCGRPHARGRACLPSRPSRRAPS
eukprot:6061249-Prymnesium_polylepis.1